MARPAGAPADGPVVACHGCSAATASLVRDALAIWLPSLVVGPTPVRAAGAPTAAVVIVEPAPDGAPALDTLREIRAGGFRGGLVLLAAPGRRGQTAPERRDDLALRQFGAALCELSGGFGDRLADAVTAVMRTAGAGAHATVRAELRRTRQQMAAGDVALRLQHSLNNPLAALLAEAQLLELEPLAPEHMAAARRIVELCRRMVAVTRELDMVRRLELPDPDTE